MELKWQTAPTYKAYDEPSEQWLEWKRQANCLSIIDLERHAAVSRDNRHSCQDCFRCAAVELLRDKRELTKPIRRLECCCCGSVEIRGRQWWNRDTGYGICVACIQFVRNHGETEVEIRDNYGIEGVHWGLEQQPELREALGEALSG